MYIYGGLQIRGPMRAKRCTEQSHSLAVKLKRIRRDESSFNIVAWPPIRRASLQIVGLTPPLAGSNSKSNVFDFF